MNKREPMLSHQGVNVYHSWKGVQALTYWYALEPNHQAERDGRDFDVRGLPQKYRRGLMIESTAPVSDPPAYQRARETMFEAHRQAIRLAIEDGHDFLGKRGGLPAIFQWLGRLILPARTR